MKKENILKDKKGNLSSLPEKLSAVIIRDMVVFPGMSLPLSVDRKRSVAAIEYALENGSHVLAVTQKDAQINVPTNADVYDVGVVCKITQSLKMPDGPIKTFIQGIQRAKIDKLTFDAKLGSWIADITYCEEANGEDEPVTTALMRRLLDDFENYAKVSKKVAIEGISFLRQTDDAGKLADTIAASMFLSTEDRQLLLETISPNDRIRVLIEIISKETQISSIEAKIHSEVRDKMDQSQKEYYLNEQLKVIQKELNQKDDFHKDIDDLREKIAKNGLSKEAAEAAEKELKRLDKMAPFSPESTVSRTYVEWLVNLPWKKTTKDVLDIAAARKVLDADHFGLDKPKERVLEYIAVCKLTKSLSGPVLCFVGPPGVGKTSLARSIATAIGRKFVRVALGGVHDESEIRGHRRTYIGSMPGRIIQNISKAKTNNPVFLLDEIDKMGKDWRGDPTAALLEVLDPEQNKEFTDHFVDVAFDISKVMFITTANSLETIPQTLRDRLEIIEFSGYTHDEKLSIAKEYLLPKQMKMHGLSGDTLNVEEKALNRAMNEYTREAGVRNLEREIATICRKAAKEYVEFENKVNVTQNNLPKYLGVPKYVDVKPSQNAVGVATGLAWTAHGGEVLTIEAVSYKGKGDIKLTGRLGDVMKESASAGLSYLKSKGIGSADFSKTDFHVHVPEGATPKDGPSAGVTITTAIASLITNKPVKPFIAMTGEITLSGRVLPVGGIKEKILAAYRDDMKEVIIPQANVKDLDDVPEKVKQAITIWPVSHIDEVLERVM